MTPRKAKNSSARTRRASRVPGIRKFRISRPRVPESRSGRIVAGVVLALFLLYLVYAVILYTTGGNDGLTRFVSNFAYYPAAKVFTPDYLWWMIGGLLATIAFVGVFAKFVWYGFSGRVMSLRKAGILGVIAVLAAVSQLWLPPVTEVAVGYGSFLERVKTLERIQSGQEQAQGLPAVPEETIKAQALQQQIASVITQQEATKLGVRVKASRVEEAYQEQADKVQGEDQLKRLLRERLGWSVREYKTELRENVLIQEALNERISEDEDLNREAREKADAARERLGEDESFAAVAEDVSEDPAASEGGSLGDIRRGEMDPAIEEVAFEIEVGAVSDVIKTDQGFVIIRVQDRDEDSVELQQITVLGKSVATHFQEILPDTLVWVLAPGLVWDDSLFTVQPKEQPEQPGAAQTGVPGASPAAQPSPAS
ncbi:MAG: peptidylprolyl isomerase [Patescibacteria group bacterium]